MLFFLNQKHILIILQNNCAPLLDKQLLGQQTVDEVSCVSPL